MIDRLHWCQSFHTNDIRRHSRVATLPSLGRGLDPMKYQPALDGIRAVAVFMVVAFHSMTPWMSGGYLGVDVFFVLSGFLITCLLLEEVNRTGTIDIRHFYARRLLRLTPALTFMLLAYLLAAPFAWPAVPVSVDARDAAISLVYLADYASAFWSLPVRLRHSWSLSVEEHFYLFWPIVMLFMTRHMSRRRIAVALVVMYAAFTAWRIHADGNALTGYSQSYYRFDTRLSGLTVGGLLGLIHSQRDRLHVPYPDWIALAAVVVLSFCAEHFRVESTSAMSYGIVAVEISTLVLIGCAVSPQPSRIKTLLSTRPLPFLGRMSYGVYLWHYPLFVYLWGRWPWYAILLVGGAISLLLAILSYHTVERAARSYWRRRRASTDKPARTLTALP